MVLSAAGPAPTLRGDGATNRLTGGSARDGFLRRRGQDTIADLSTAAPEAAAETVTDQA